MKITLLHPFALLLLPLALLPLLPRRRCALPVSSLAPLDAIPDSWPVRLGRLQPWLAALLLLTVLTALSGPALEERFRQTVREGVDLMLALDVSASMGATDMPPDRISRARQAAAAFLRGRSGDRVGVVLFSGTTYLLSPPTAVTAPLLARLQSVAADRSGSGTALGDALAAAADRLRESDARSKAVILLTDGTSNRGRIAPLAAARAAAALGIRVYTIGFGSESGGEVPLAPAGGRPVRDVLEEEPLRQIARLTGARYFRASDPGALAAVFNQIDPLETSPLLVRETVARKDLAPDLARLAAFLLLAEILLFRLWLRRVP